MTVTATPLRYAPELRPAQTRVLDDRGVRIYCAYRHYGLVKHGARPHPADAYWAALQIVRDHQGNPPAGWPPLKT